MKYYLFILFCLAVSGCSTYIITLESFEHQFAAVDSTKLRTVEVNIPIAAVQGITNLYKANPIDTIDCIDGDNHPVRLANSPSIEMRVTQKNDDRTIFYFDTVYLQDSVIHGAKSRFLPFLRDAIPLNSVKLIEVQDGKKDYHYINSSR
jgi:hypothetical protein